MPKDSSVKYYQENNVRSKIGLAKGIKRNSEEEKEKQQQHGYD